MTTYLLGYQMELICEDLNFTFSSCATFDLIVYALLLLSTFVAAWKALGWIRSIGKLIFLMCIFCLMINLLIFFIVLLEKRISWNWNDIQVGMVKELSRTVSSLFIGTVTYLINSITCIIRLPRL